VGEGGRRFTYQPVGGRRRFGDPPVMVTALLTPFDAQGEVDRDVLGEHVDYLVGSGVDGLLAAGTTGEGASLTDDEVVTVTAAAVRAAGGRVPVIAHVGRVSTRATVALAGRAIAEGADALAAVVPYFDPLSAEQIAGHYCALLAAAGPTPVYAYNIPDRTGNDLAAATVERLAAAGIAGVKDSTTVMARHLEYLEAARRAADDGHPIDVFTGADAQVVPSFAAGATGSVNAIGNFRPELFADLKKAVTAGDAERAAAIGNEIALLRDGLAVEPLLRSLKRAAAANLATVGIRYPTDLRAPAS
jgi:4-hydroxy-tetrahydrodipicolinate synthase